MVLLDIILASGVDYRQRGNEVNLCCPWCVERGETEDTKYRLGINVRTGAGHCFNCGFRERSIYYLGKKLCQVWNLKFNLREAMRSSTTEELMPKLQDKPHEMDWPHEYETFTNTPDQIERQARDYLKSRGISLLQIARHKIGFSVIGTFAWRILFPVLCQGKCYGFCGRDFSGKQEPKYLNSKGIKLLWGGDVKARTAIVVEGVVDALHVEQAVMSRPSTTSVATLGCAMTEAQFQQLKAFEKIVLLPDQDSPGVNGVITLAKKCAVRSIQTLVVVPSDLNGRDAGEMNSEEIVSLISDAQPWSTNVEHKLQAVLAKEGML